MGPTRIFCSFLAAAALSLGLLGTPPALAQTWLAAAFPNDHALGPEKAKGAVIWNHGRSVNSEDSEAPTPAYMALLREDGWDTFRFNRMRADDTLEKSSQVLAAIVHK